MTILLAYDFVIQEFGEAQWGRLVCSTVSGCLAGWLEMTGNIGGDHQLGSYVWALSSLTGGLSTWLAGSLAWESQNSETSSLLAAFPLHGGRCQPS